jgi:hypothetical protein
MKTENRIQKIEDFMQTQHYLLGCQFLVKEIDDDRFQVEFVKASQRQIHTLKHRLRANEMHHIDVIAREVVESHVHKKHGKHKSSRKNSPNDTPGRG